MMYDNIAMTLILKVLYDKPPCYFARKYCDERPSDRHLLYSLLEHKYGII